MRLQSSEREVACGPGRRKLTTRNFGTGTRGFAAPEDSTTAVCLLPGTELAFCEPVAIGGRDPKMIAHKTAIFRQVDKEQP